MISFFTPFAKMLGWRALAVIAAVVGLFVLTLVLQNRALSHQLQDANRKLAVAESTIRAQQVVIDELQVVANARQETQRIVEHVIEQIEASPNAGTPIPDDIASVWRDGIMRLRDNAGIRSDSGSFTELPPP